MEIINLQSKHPQPNIQLVHTYLERNNYPREIWNGGDTSDSMTDYSAQSDVEFNAPGHRTLAYRPRRTQTRFGREKRRREIRGSLDSGVEDSSASSSEAEGFEVVHRQKRLSVGQPSTFLGLTDGTQPGAATSNCQIDVANHLPTHLDHPTDDPFADPGSISADDEAELDDDAASVSSVETLKPEIGGTHSGQDAVPVVAPNQDIQESFQSDSSDIELVSYDSSSDSDWSVIGKEDLTASQPEIAS